MSFQCCDFTGDDISSSGGGNYDRDGSDHDADSCVGDDDDNGGCVGGGDDSGGGYGDVDDDSDGGVLLMEC